MGKPAASVEVKGLRELQLALRALGAEWPRELRKANVDVARIAQDASQHEASGLGGVQAKAAPAIKAGGEQLAAKIVVSATAAYPFALGAFFGAKKYPQFPPWVGNSWDPGGPGGPYAINAALRSKLDEITDAYGDAMDRLTAKAFPD